MTKQASFSIIIACIIACIALIAPAIWIALGIWATNGPQGIFPNTSMLVSGEGLAAFFIACAAAIIHQTVATARAA